MSSHVTNFISEIEKLRKQLTALGGAQVHSAKTRAALHDLATRYFSDIRPTLIEPPGEDRRIDAINTEMQRLLELCHKRGVASGYIEILRKAKGHLIHLDGALIYFNSQNQHEPNHKTPVDVKIIVTLRALLPSAALSYEQALQDLGQMERLSWRGPATDLREALRETLDRLAPDNEVKAMPGYKDEPEARGPTMKQKVRFILRSRQTSKALAATTEDATKLVDEAVGTFVRSVYTRSSVSTHTPTDKSEVLRILDLVRVVLSELLEAR